MLSLAVLVSGGGTNLQAIIDAIENNSIKGAKVGLVISSSESAYAIERAKKQKIKEDQDILGSKKRIQNNLSRK